MLIIGFKRYYIVSRSSRMMFRVASGLRKSTRFHRDKVPIVICGSHQNSIGAKDARLFEGRSIPLNASFPDKFFNILVPKFLTFFSQGKETCEETLERAFKKASL